MITVKAVEEALAVLEGEPEYHDNGMGCGLEDRNITDLYDAMHHGWECAMERVYAEHINPAKEILSAITNMSGDDEAPVAFSLRALQRAHVERQEEWCPDQKPDLSFRGNELGGECGEAQNVIKKLERERLGWLGSRDTVDHLGEELADVIHCAVLCAITAGIDLEPAVIAKFNSTSEKNGLSTFLARPQSAAVRDEDAEPADPWLSIDSAPKDGTRIVGWGNGEARVTTHERYRKGSIGYAQGRQDTWWEYIERETCFHWEPTHWIPLPSAPALRETKEV
jgi:NTP pyrophosphatase (non-canonical NTP hydrolase)